MAADEIIDVSGAVLVLDTGPVFLELAVIPVVDVERVWRGLEDLNQAALGGPAMGLGHGLTAVEAYDAWSRTTLGLDGYLRAISPGAAANVLDSATDYAEFRERLDGIDSVFLSAFSSASRDMGLTGASLDGAARALERYGLPNVPSGGAAHTFFTNVTHGTASLSNHDSLRTKLERSDGDFVAVAAVLANEGIGVAAGGAESLIPGSGVYVKAAGKAIVAASEGAAWGVAAGTLVPGLGQTAGAILGAIFGFTRSVIISITSSEAKGDKVPVSPPVPVTDQHGKTTRVGPDGHTAPGRSTGGPHPPPPPGRPPGPKAKEVHCPRGDEDTVPEVELPGWRSEFELIPSLGPNGSGLDGLIAEGAAVQLPAAAQLSLNAEITTFGLWGELLAKQSVGPDLTGGPGTVEVGQLTRLVEVARRVQLAEALARHADPSATLEDALAAMRRDADTRLRGRSR